MTYIDQEELLDWLTREITTCAPEHKKVYQWIIDAIKSGSFTWNGGDY